MVEWVVSTLLENFSMVMLIAAIAIAVARWSMARGRSSLGLASQLLGWLLLFSLGLQGVYTFVLHVFFPGLSAAAIGWAESPFQYEVGIANLAVGVLGILGFWANFSFRLAAALAGIVWYGGDAVGHVRQMIVAKNFAPGNAGSWFWTDVLVPVLLVTCIGMVWRQERLRLS